MFYQIYTRVRCFFSPFIKIVIYIKLDAIEINILAFTLFIRRNNYVTSFSSPLLFIRKRIYYTPDEFVAARLCFVIVATGGKKNSNSPVWWLFLYKGRYTDERNRVTRLERTYREKCLKNWNDYDTQQFYGGKKNSEIVLETINLYASQITILRIRDNRAVFFLIIFNSWEVIKLKKKNVFLLFIFFKN